MREGIAGGADWVGTWNKDQIRLFILAIIEQSDRLSFSDPLD